MDLSVIIVNYNTRDKLRKCLRSVYNSRTKYSFEVFVADNSSSDGSVKMVRHEFAGAYLIVNSENLGYAKANNAAMRQAKGRYILLLNPDVIISSDTFDKMLSFMDNDNTIGVSGCKVVKPNGELDLASRRSFPNPVNSFFRLTGLSFLFPKSKLASYNLTYLDEDKIAEVDSVVGAFLLIRKEALGKIGLLDEAFFMYGEDLDWCMRAKRAGYKVVYAPITAVVHDKGSASRKASNKALYEFHRSMQIFYDKHYADKYNFLISLIVKIGIWTRYLWKKTINSFRKEKIVSR